MIHDFTNDDDHMCTHIKYKMSDHLDACDQLKRHGMGWVTQARPSFCFGTRVSLQVKLISQGNVQLKI